MALIRAGKHSTAVVQSHVLSVRPNFLLNLNNPGLVVSNPLEYDNPELNVEPNSRTEYP